MRRSRLLLLLAVVLALPAAADEPLTSAPYSVRDTTAARLTLEDARGAFAAGDVGRGATELQRLLDELREDLVALPPTVPPPGRDVQVRYVSAPEAALRELAALPAEVRTAYADAVVPGGTEALGRAVEHRDEARLRDLLRRYAGTPVGLAAARRLAESAAQAGRPHDAAAAAREGLRFAPDDAGLWVRRIDALRAARDGLGLAGLALPPTVAERAFPAGGPTLAARLAAARAAVPPPGPPTDVPTWGVTAAHDGVTPWDHVLRPLRWAEGRPPRDRRNDEPPAVGRFGPDFGGRDQAALQQRRFLATPYVPCAVGRLLVVSDGFTVEARDLLSGRLAWRFPDAERPARHLAVVRPDEGVLDGRTNVDVAYAPCAADGLVYATVEVEDRGYTPRRLHMIDITTYRPRRVLVALDAATGALRWSMGQHVADARALEDVTVGGGPVVAEGLVVFTGVRFLKRWEARLVALDARTGRLAWQRTVVTSQQELNLFGEPVKEMWAGTPAVADGTVYAPTGLGVFVAADLRDGTVRWLSSYDTLPIERVDLWYETPIRLSRWAPSPTVVRGDLVLAAPAESEHLLCFDRRDGRLAWRWAAEQDGHPYVDHFVGVAPGGAAGLAIVTGATLRAVDLATGNPVWGNRFSSGARVRGRGAISGTRVYVPTTEGLDAFSLAGEGRLVAPSPMPWPEGAQPGNVLLTPRVLVVSGGQTLTDEGTGLGSPVQAFFAPDDIEREIAARRAAAPADPGPALESGDLWRLVGRDGRAEAAYDDARRLAEAAGDAAAAEHAREGLLLLDRERGDAALAARRTMDARSAYEAALARARTPAERVTLRLRLDRVFAEAGVEAARVRNLVALIAEAEGERAVFDPREGPVPARAAARFRLADLHRGAARVADAVDVLQEVLREDRDARFRGDPAPERAERWIATILAQTGPGAYVRHEAEAARRLEAAAGGDDPAPFEAILREFPNARAVPAALLGLASRELAAGRAADAAETLGRFLSAYPDHDEAPRATALLVRALEGAGARGRARAALTRLERRFADASFPWEGAPVTGRAFAAAERARLGTPAPRPPGPPLALHPEERLTETVDGQGIGSRCVEVEGRDAAEGVVPALVQAEDLVVALDPATARAAWRLSLPGTAHAALAGDTLVIAAGDVAVGVEPATGVERWRRELPGSVLDLGVSLGQVVALLQQITVAARTSLVALDPISGAVAYRRDLDGEAAGVLKAADEGLVVVRNRSGAAPAVTATLYAPLTGDRVFELPRGFDGL
ncbi:MAG: PQQ-binding-like beta-propeller repeat protein, partial [Planctomycetia bacterium]|nr:PQQ-binding-like beta-propeller repeat protein [Planctomycetia bacterium]